MANWTETAFLRAAIIANGGTYDDLPDNLESTLYERLTEVCASGGGGGGGLPAGSDPYQQLVTDAEGKTVWDDRLAYETVGEVVILPENSYALKDADDMWFFASIDGWPIVVGKSYTVVWNGVRYECVAKQSTDDDDIWLGRETDDSDVPFKIMYRKIIGVDGSFAYQLVILPQGSNFGETNTVEILASGEVTKKIDPKWLPEGIGYEDPNALTEILPEEVLLSEDGMFLSLTPLTELLEAGRTYVVKWNGVTYERAAQVVHLEGDGAPGFTVIGNPSLLTGNEADMTDDPFCIVDASVIEGALFSIMVAALDGSTSVTLAISKRGSIHRIPLKFLPKYMYGMEQSDRAEVLSERTVSSVATASIDEPFTNPLVEGCEYTVILNGTEYKSTAKLADDGTEIYIGAYKGATDDPYYVRYVLPEYSVMTGHYGVVYNGLSEAATIKVIGPGESIRKVPNEYIDSEGLIAEAKPFIVTASKTTDVTYWNFDATYNEILAAYEAGKTLYCRLKSYQTSTVDETKVSIEYLPLMKYTPPQGNTAGSFVFAAPTGVGSLNVR